MTLSYDQLLAAGAILAVFCLMALMLAVTSAQRAMSVIRITELEAARAPSDEQRANELAHVKALVAQAQETALFTRLSLEMGFPLPDGEDDDTIVSGN